MLLAGRTEQSNQKITMRHCSNLGLFTPDWLVPLQFFHQQLMLIVLSGMEEFYMTYIMTYWSLYKVSMAVV